MTVFVLIGIAAPARARAWSGRAQAVNEDRTVTYVRAENGRVDSIE